MAGPAMDAERWKQVDELLQSVLAEPSDRRDEFLRRSCAGDAALEKEVRSLLTSHGNAGGFLEDPAIKIAAKAIALTDTQDVADSLLGKTISHYRVVRRLGSGGIGGGDGGEENRPGRRPALQINARGPAGGPGNDICGWGRARGALYLQPHKIAPHY